MISRRLRVLFDPEIMGLQVHGGISRYFVELVRHLPAHGVDPVLFAPVSFNHYMRERRPPGLHGFSIPPRFRNRYTTFVQRKLLSLAGALCAHTVKHDLVHRTYYGRTLSGPQVATVVDMIPEVLPEYFPGGNPHRGKESAIAAASLIICISRQTRADLIRLMPHASAPIHVIHLAVDSAFFSERAAAAGSEDSSIVYVGGRDAYKNFSTFAKASAMLLAEQRALHVVVVGGGALSRSELAPFIERGVSDRVVQMAATDGELAAVYRRAFAFVFPSRYEGFGLPILEAFASGCPVVLANASCFPEIAEDAALYFNPNDPLELLDTLRRVTSDGALRAELRARGTRRLGAFSWDRTARLTAEAYRGILE